MDRQINHRFLTAALCSFGILASGQALPADNFSIEISDDDIAVQANNASLKELLLELERRTGIPVKFVAETDERVSLNVGLTNIENAIGKITPNHMIVHSDKNGKKVIKELIIIPVKSDVGGGSTSSFLPNGQPAPEIEQLPSDSDSMPMPPPEDLQSPLQLETEQAPDNYAPNPTPVN